jgi:peroxiredoxin
MRFGVAFAFIFACLLGAARRGPCDEGLLPGHSHHGEAFDHGPRHSAYLMGGTGKIHFPVSSKDPLVQKFIEQGIGQLHGFWFVEAERSFRQAAALDPQCGIAYWGMSLANEELDAGRAQQFASEAARHKTGLSNREQLYIDAIRDQGGYQAIIAKYPDDLEAKAFEVWRLWHKREGNDRSDSLLKAADELTTQILRAEPMHPIHHAVIHFADSANAAEQVLDSAVKCGESAPGIGHMWHMPTHTYYARQRYPQAAWQLEAADRTENSYSFRDWANPSHLYAHNNEWLIRALLRLGRVHDAREIAVSLIDLPREPLSGAFASRREGPSPDDSKSERPVEVQASAANYGRIRLIQVLRDYEYWDELRESFRSGYIELTGPRSEQQAIRASLGMVCYCLGDVTGGDHELSELHKLLDEELTAVSIDTEHAGNSVEGRPPSPQVDTGLASEISQTKQYVDGLENYRRILTGTYINRQTLILSLIALVGAEACGIGFLRRHFVIAIVTLVVALAAGAWLVQCHLALLGLSYGVKDIDGAVLSRVLLRAGDPEEAVFAASNFAVERHDEVRPQANLVETMYKAGRKDRARAELEKLRELAGEADLDSPPLARLEPIAREFGLPADWRLPGKIQQALAGRRPLESLGPLLWQPWVAPEWKLSDASGHEHSLEELRGKPVILLFSLGEGCLHCKAQLEAFVKNRSQWEAEGWVVVAISSDNRNGIQKSLESYKPGPFPFLMLADPDLEAFRSYRAYDDFERIALHGTFLIDPSGRVRWSDVGSEPFTDLAFLFGEFKRLLARPVPVAAK